MRSTPLICLIGTLACSNGLAPEPGYVFGRVEARIGQTVWESSYFPDSVVAFYDPAAGHLQITGQLVGPG